MKASDECSELLFSIFQAWGVQRLPLWNRGCSGSSECSTKLPSSNILTFIVCHPSHSEQAEKSQLALELPHLSMTSNDHLSPLLYLCMKYQELKDVINLIFLSAHLHDLLVSAGPLCHNSCLRPFMSAYFT